MPETVSTLEIGAGPADDAVAGSIRIPVAVPAHLAGHGVRIAPVADGSVRRRRLAIRRTPFAELIADIDNLRWGYSRFLNPYSWRIQLGIRPDWRGPPAPAQQSWTGRMPQQPWPNATRSSRSGFASLCYFGKTRTGKIGTALGQNAKNST